MWGSMRIRSSLWHVMSAHFPCVRLAMSMSGGKVTRSVPNAKPALNATKVTQFLRFIVTQIMTCHASIECEWKLKECTIITTVFYKLNNFL
jgi:hypothetical protein